MTDLQIEGGDLLSQDAIRSVVREIYGGVAPADRRVAERLYSAEEISSIPDETVRMALGVGNPVRHAGLRPGEDVVDLGSGGGIDCLLAAKAVGASGSVVGVGRIELDEPPLSGEQAQHRHLIVLVRRDLHA